MSNTAGQAHALSVLCPIHPERLASLQRTLAELPLGSESPLAGTGTTHFARWVVIEQLVDEGHGQKLDHLSCPYLLFTSNTDGDLDGYLRRLCETSSRDLHRVWSHCIGYPTHSDDDSLITYLRRNQVDTSLFYSAYPSASVAQVLQALELRRRFIEFAVENQDSEDEALMASFRSEFGDRVR